MPTETDLLFSKKTSLNTMGDECSAESADLLEQAEALGWETDGETSQQATELMAQSWAALGRAAGTWAEANTYELKIWAGLDEVLFAIYSESDELYAQWKDSCDAGVELCTRIAALYGEDAPEEDIDELWTEHDQVTATFDELSNQIGTNEAKSEAHIAEASAARDAEETEEVEEEE